MLKPYYEESGIVIYHGDCREILPHLPKVDLVLTDPPYGIGEANGKNKSRGKLAAAKDYGVASWDDAPPPSWLMSWIRETSTLQIIFGGNYFALPPSPCWLVWDKENEANDFADCELAWTNLPKAVRKFKWRWNGMLQEDMSKKETRHHPTQKPLPLMKWCIAQAGDVKTILDPFMGSGTTLLAARAMGASCIGIEREEKYCTIAAERLRQQMFSFDDIEDAALVNNGKTNNQVSLLESAAA